MMVMERQWMMVEMMVVVIIAMMVVGGEVLIPVMMDFSIKWRRRLKPVKKKGIGLL